MKRTARRAALTALMSAAVAASLVVGAPSAFAINSVPCDRPDYLSVYFHSSAGNNYHNCYANAGTVEWGLRFWVTRIETGNNRVQWWGDGRWQPAEPINKWTVFLWPNHPGGVSMERIRIL